MKFLCDVHISYRVIDFLKGRGFESIHVNSFPKNGKLLTLKFVDIVTRIISF
jgi:predicted nuclease of predicted toxin-antitoxin system